MGIRQLGISLDAIIVGFLIFQTFLGWRRGLLWQVLGVVSIIFGIGLGLLLAPLIGAQLTECVTSDPFRAKLAAFLLVLGVVGFTLRLAGAWAEVRTEQGAPRQERELRRMDDRILGGIFGALKGCVLTLVILAASASFYPRSALWQYSQLAPPLASAGARLLPEGTFTEVKRWGSQSLQELKQGLDIR